MGGALEGRVYWVTGLLQVHPACPEYGRGAVVSTRTRTVLAQDWVLWGAVGCALVGTAYSEWNLAVSVGAHPWIAAAVPGALDLYVLRALQVRRDVLLAVLAMVAANVAWYLVHSGDLPVGWQLRSAVGALAPLILWRVHSLKYGSAAPSPATSTPEYADTGAVSAPEEYTPSTPGCTHVMCQVHSECQITPAVLEELAAEVHVLGTDPVPEHVLAEWTEQQDKRVRRRSTGTPPYLSLVPDEYGRVQDDPGMHPAVLEGALLASDVGYIARAKEYMGRADTPSARGLRGHIGPGVGQDRAKRLFQYLKGQTP